MAATHINANLEPIMYHFADTLVHCCRDEDGLMEVIDSYGVRSLHFGTRPKQSSMALDEPERLELPYVRAMLAPLLFTEAPCHILMLGLGGGSLAKFLLENYPKCSIDVAERRAEIVRIAHEYFELPRTERLKTHVADGCAFFAEKAKQTPGHYDLIFIDGYDHEGMDQSINASDFFSACAALLKPKGAFSINMWGSHAPTLRCSMDLLRTCFPERSLVLPVLNKGNVIGIGLREGLPTPVLHRTHSKAKALEIQLGIEMPFLYQRLRSL